MADMEPPTPPSPPPSPPPAHPDSSSPPPQPHASASSPGLASHPDPSPPGPPATQDDPHPPHRFDPSRMIGIIRRKALIKDLAAVYHAECLKYCQELLELQRKWEEPFVDMKTPEVSRKETMRAPKRTRKSR